MNTQFLLDRTGTAELPAGFTAITDEIEFARQAVQANAQLLIRGASLCRWAETFARARSITCQNTYSIADRLQMHHPGLSPDECRQLQALLEQSPSGRIDPDTLKSPDAILNHLYPHRIWHNSPDENHAAEWIE